MLFTQGLNWHQSSPMLKECQWKHIWDHIVSWADLITKWAQLFSLWAHLIKLWAHITSLWATLITRAHHISSSHYELISLGAHLITQWAHLITWVVVLVLPMPLTIEELSHQHWGPEKTFWNENMWSIYSVGWLLPKVGMDQTDYWSCQIMPF